MGRDRRMVILTIEKLLNLERIAPVPAAVQISGLIVSNKRKEDK